MRKLICEKCMEVFDGFFSPNNVMLLTASTDKQ